MSKNVADDIVKKVTHDGTTLRNSLSVLSENITDIGNVIFDENMSALRKNKGVEMIILKRIVAETKDGGTTSLYVMDSGLHTI